MVAVAVTVVVAAVVVIVVVVVVVVVVLTVPGPLLAVGHRNCLESVGGCPVYIVEAIDALGEASRMQKGLTGVCEVTCIVRIWD